MTDITLTKAQIELLLARASDPEYTPSEFTLDANELRALCSLALVGLDVQTRPMKEFPPLDRMTVYQVALVTNGKHTGEARRSHSEPQWAWSDSRQWCDPQPTHFIPLTALPESPNG